MNILKDSITHLASQGRLTLQIPDTAISLGGSSQPQMEDVPDEWVCVLRGTGGAPSLGKESGFLFLTRAGYEANKERLKAAFEAAIAAGMDRTNGVGWPAFEKSAEDHFRDVAKSTKRLIQNLDAKLRQAKKFKA